ncbi:MAG TPA: zinc-ribbon domain-containing protein [Ktedonobacterales bacterium]|nr:zinc-ribbon domain-containing protein [Ktedonobacterales bacterium]
MQCWQCGADVRPGERTCGYCGARLAPPSSAGRPLLPPQPHYPSPRQGPRSPRDESDYDAGYTVDDESDYGAAYPPDDRANDWRGGHGGMRSRDDDDWDDARPTRHRQPHGRLRPHPEPDAHGSHGQPGGYDDDYASEGHEPREPNPLDDPRAPRNLRSGPRRPSDTRSGSRENRPLPPDFGDVGEGRPRRPPTDPAHNRGRGYAPEGKLPPLTEERQGFAPEPYDSYGEAGRSRRSRPSGADNRYSRPPVSRGQPSRYEGEYGDEYDNDYGEYDDRPNAPGQGYGRRMPPDQRPDAYQQRDMQSRSWQQRWEDTIGSVRIPGIRRQEGDSDGKSSSRRIVTSIVFLLVLVGAIIAGGVTFVPRALERLHPAPASSSPLCAPAGPASTGALPAPSTHFKQFTSARSHYGMNYPETWTVEPQQKVASGYDYIDVFTLPQSSTSVTVEQAEAACALSDINIIQAEVAVAQQQKITFTENTSTATTQTIGGEQWQRREYDVSDKGVTLHMVILACHHQGRAYVIVLVSRTTTFKQDNTGIFQPMLKSFTFTK